MIWQHASNRALLVITSCTDVHHARRAISIKLNL